MRHAAAGRVQLYRNLRPPQEVRWMGWDIAYSVRDSRTGKVIKYVERALLCEVRLHVSQAGRARVRATRRKNVHAWVEGTPLEYGPQALAQRPEGCSVRLRYDPYAGADGEPGAFRDERGRVWERAFLVYVGPDGVWADPSASPAD